jgi:programmed cell death protein 4
VISGDIAEAARCLGELDVPHFHHELVKRALLAAFGDSAHAAPLLKLLAALSDSGQVNQVLPGLRAGHADCKHSIEPRRHIIC